MSRRQALLWGTVFVAIIGLHHSQLLFTYNSEPSFLGLPEWIWFFILFHLLFLVALYFFIYRSNSN